MFKTQIFKLRSAIQNFNYSYTTAVNLPNRLSNQDWQDAKPFESLPGPTKYQLLKGFMPGGFLYKKSLVEFQTQLRSVYGEIFLVPGLFGKPDILFTFNPHDYQQVFRTEGMQPIRRGLNLIHYHRKVLRKNTFKYAAGLIAEQGEGWSTFRSIVNPVMMNPKTIKMYVPKIDKVATKFIQRIRVIREIETQEVPENFELEMKNFVMDSVGILALDTDLNMIQNSDGNPKAKAIIEGMKEFLELLYELDLKPSLWKIIPTPKFKKIIKRLDLMTELTQFYIKQAIERIEKEKVPKLESEKSILERLVHIDPLIAMTMSMDMFVSGIDTTSSALTGCLLGLAKNPEKQTKLREELLKVLPHKSTHLTQENMKNLPYLRACIKESFRIHPVSTLILRTAGQDIVLSGYRVPSGTDVGMTAELLLKDSRYYSQPNNFLPERWLRSTAASVAAKGECPLNKNEPFAFLQFGFGPRMCIGKRIVDLELEVVLAKLVRNFEIKFDYPTEDMYKTNIINFPSKALKFKFYDLDY